MCAEDSEQSVRLSYEMFSEFKQEKRINDELKRMLVDIVRNKGYICPFLCSRFKVACAIEAFTPIECAENIFANADQTMMKLPAWVKETITNRALISVNKCKRDNSDIF